MTKVLIVEDEPSIREIVSQILELEGIHTQEAADGQEALEILSKEEVPPQVILLDLMMPVMTGWEFLKVRAKDPVLRAIPVIAVTAAPQYDELPGVHTVLGKPIELPNLIQAISDLAARKSGTA